MLILEFEDDFRIQKISLDELGVQFPPHRHGEFNIAYDVMTKETNPDARGRQVQGVRRDGGRSADSFTFIVGAVADKPTIEFLSGDDDEHQFKQTEIEFAMQLGANDSGATAQDLGSLGGPNSQVSVGGWISSADPDDFDFYRFTLTESGSVYFDIDMGIVGLDSVDTQLSLFAEDGTQLILPDFSSLDDAEAGADDDSAGADVTDPVDPANLDPFFTLDLDSGTYFVAVSSFNNDPDFDGNNQNQGSIGTTGDYMLQIRTEFEDIETTMLSESGPLEKLGTEELVNFDDTSGEQSTSDIAALANGGYVVAWRHSSGDTIFQIYDADGNPVGGNTTVIAAGSIIQTPKVIGLADGRFIVTYTDSDDEGIGVFAKIYNPDGTESLGATQVNTFEGNDADDDLQHQLDAAALVGPNAGKVVFVWRSELVESGDSGGDIFLRFFDAASDSFITGEMQVNDISSAPLDNNQVGPAIAGLSNGGYVVIWSTEHDGSSQGVRGEVFGANGVQVGAGGSDLNITGDTFGSQNNAEVAGLKEGGFVAVWSDNGGPSIDGIDIVARIFDNDGNEVVAPFVVNTTTAGVQSAPDVTALMDGGFLITWHNGSPGSRDIMAQRYDSDGKQDRRRVPGPHVGNFW